MKFLNYKEDKLFIDEETILEPTNNQVQIEIHSTSVNRADLLQKKGHYPPPKGESEILGLECAGIISKIGFFPQNKSNIKLDPLMIPEDSD